MSSPIAILISDLFGPSRVRYHFYLSGFFLNFRDVRNIVIPKIGAPGDYLNSSPARIRNSEARPTRQPRRVSPPWPPCRAPPPSLPGVPRARTQPARRAPWWPCSHLLGVPWRSPMARSPLPGASPSQATSSPWCFPAALCSDSCWPRTPCFSLAGAPCVLGFKFLCARSTAPIASSSLPRLSSVWPTPIRVRSYRHRRVVAADSFACASSSRVESLSSSPRRPTSYLLCSPALATRWCSNSSAVVVLSASARDRGSVRRVRQRSVANSTVVAVVRFVVCSPSVVGCTSTLVLAAGSR
jgi:hypothetical protein